MKRVRLFWVKTSLLSAALGLLGVSACGGGDEPDSSGDGDDSTAGGSGGEMVVTGGTTGTGGAGSGGELMATGGAAPLGTGGGMGGDGGGTGGACAGISNPLGLPELLSETGLYEADMETLGAGVRPFRPRFALWSDGAEKRRWVALPEGEQIDTSEMDYWQLPIGTKLWKEFSRGDKRLETRLLERKCNGVWVMVAYQWRDDLSDADKVSLGVPDASDTTHDIPSEDQCWSCHNQMPGRVLGFSAIQLAHDAGTDVPGTPAENEWTLSELASEGLLTDAPPDDLSIPGTEVEQAALSYLHVNCGNCHNPNSSLSRVNLDLWLTVDGLDAVENTTTYRTTVEVSASLAAEAPPGGTHRITADAQDLQKSVVYSRFNTVGEDYSMPPLGTEIIDPEGEAAIREWIEFLAEQP